MDGEALATDDKNLHGARIKLSKIKSSIMAIRRKKDGLQVLKPEIQTICIIIATAGC